MRYSLQRWWGASSVVGSKSSGSKDDFNEVIEKAFDIEEEDGSDAMLEYLTDNGYANAHHEVSYDIALTDEEVHDEGEKIVEPQEIDDVQGEGVKATMTGIEDRFTREHHISLRFELWFEVDGWESFFGDCKVEWTELESYGSDPKDATALGWNTQQERYWDLASTDKISEFAFTRGDYAETTEEWDHDSIGFRVNDSDAFLDWYSNIIAEDEGCGQGSDGEYYDLGRTGVKLKPAGTHDPDDREVYGGYSHAYDTTSVNTGIAVGLSATGPSISLAITPENQVNSITTTTETDKDTILKISQSDITI